ncbi:4642_t:CDS:2, partial [Gigaspora margarita]
FKTGVEEIDVPIRLMLEGVNAYSCSRLKCINPKSLINLMEVRSGYFGTIYSADYVDGRGGVNWRETIRVAVRITDDLEDYVKEIHKGIEIMNDMDDLIYQALGLFGFTQFDGQVSLVAGTFCNNCGGLLNNLAWCMKCEFIQYSPGWTSGNQTYDQIILMSQYKMTKNPNAPCFRWISPQNLKNLVKVSNNEFGTIYNADWMEGEYDGPLPSVLKCWSIYFHPEDTDSRFVHELGKDLVSALDREDGIRFCDKKRALFGISRLSGQNKYALVAGSVCNICCGIFNEHSWCSECDSKRLMHGWTSGEPIIDEIIKSTQREAFKWNYPCLRWVPPEQLQNIQQIGRGGFSIVYSADWPNDIAKLEYQIFINYCQRFAVNNNETLGGALVKCQEYDNPNHEAIGVSKLKDQFVLVTKLAENGNLSDFLANNPSIKWSYRLSILLDIARSLRNIHKSDIIHRDLHGGNVLINSLGNAVIIDFGRAVSKETSESLNDVMGVPRYMAPELFIDQVYTKYQPFLNRKIDKSFINDIIAGLHPEFQKGTPQFYIDFAENCMHLDPIQRPTADDVYKKIDEWLFYDNPNSNGVLINALFKESKVNEEARRLFEKADEERLFTKLDQEPKVPNLEKISISKISDLERISISKISDLQNELTIKVWS